MAAPFKGERVKRWKGEKMAAPTNLLSRQLVNLLTCQLVNQLDKKMAMPTDERVWLV